MAIDPISASKAYLEAARAAQRAMQDPASEGVGPTGGADFGSMVQTALKDVSAQLQGAEKVSLAAASGRADVVDVATAVAAAETSLETVIAVRDQVIQAYQEIMRMPI